MFIAIRGGLRYGFLGPHKEWLIQFSIMLQLTAQSRLPS